MNTAKALHPEKIIRAALYPRVSTEEQVLHGDSLAAQEEELRRFAKAHGMKIVGVYRDEGNSARKPAFKRKVMMELLKDIEAGKIDRVLVTKLDRWFRNVREYHKIQEILEAHNVAWQATLESYETATADGRFKVNIMLSVAENEADRTSERIKFVNESKRQRKEACSGRVSYGYKVELINGAKRVVKDPETREFVQDFWDHYRKYESIRLAGMYVNEKHGIKRTYKAWGNTARSQMHTGIWRGVEDYCEPYISPEDWQRLHDYRIQKTSPNPSRVYLFTGLLNCPYCGARMVSTFSHPNKNGVVYKNYRCRQKRMNVCQEGETVAELKIEGALLSMVRSELEKFIMEVEVMEQAPKKKDSTMDVAKLTEQMRRLNAIYMAGNIDDDEYAKQTAGLKLKIEAAKAAAKDEVPPDIDVLRQFLKSDFETIYKTLDPEDKRRMWRSIIQEICVKDHKIQSIKFRA